MKRYIKNGVIKTRNQIVIKKNGKQYINPIEDMILADGWVEHIIVPYEPTEEEILNREKEFKIEEIIRHDSSPEVNCFFIGDRELWLDKATRVGLKLRFDAEIASGHTNTTLWYEGTPFNLKLANAVQMLNAIELYASACYDNTQMHIATVKSMEMIDDIKSYDYRTGYPDKLIF
jgi:hypothetical protein